MNRRNQRQLVRQARQYLLAEGHRLFEQPGAPRKVELRRHRTVLFATLTFGDTVARAVVKPVDETARVVDPAGLCALHERVRGEAADSAAHLPWLRPGPAGAGWLVAEFFPGETLLTCADRALKRGGAEAAVFVDALGRAADALARVHRIPAAAVALVPAIGRETDPEPNGKYLAGFNELWIGSPLCRMLPEAYHGGPAPLLDRLGAGFADRVGDKLLIVDSQPKNIVVSANRQPRFIDIDYSCGNPAMATAHFLVSLDRLGLKRPLAGAGRIDRWKRLFVARYGRGCDAETLRDVLFFYPWLLLRVSGWHTGIRNWLGPLLRRFYARRLSEFCLRVSSAGALDTPEAVADLFADPAVSAIAAA